MKLNVHKNEQTEQGQVFEKKTYLPEMGVKRSVNGMVFDGFNQIFIFIGVSSPTSHCDTNWWTRIGWF